MGDSDDSLITLLRWCHVAAAPYVHSVDAEIAEFVLVGHEQNVRLVSDAVIAQFELEVHDVFERRTFARAAPMTCPNDEPLPVSSFHPLDQGKKRLRRLFRVIGRASRKTVLARARPLGYTEV